MPKYHRIQIDDRAYKALIAESIGRDGVDIRDIASQILIAGVSKEALIYSGQFSATFDEMPSKSALTAGFGNGEVLPGPGATPGRGAAEVAQKIAKKAPPTPTGKRGGKKVPVSDEVKAQVRKRKLENSELSNRDIAREIGLSPAMINKILNVKEESKD